MKKTYISPVLYSTDVQLESHLLTDSNEGLTVGSSQSISGTTNFVKERGSREDYNVWNEDWSN